MYYFALAVSTIAASVFILTFGYALHSVENTGTFGDTFGVATSFFSMLTLGFLVWAVALQRKEIQLVREERDDARELLRGQETITKHQSEALYRQQFELRFNTLTALISQEISALDRVVSDPDSYTAISKCGKIARRLLEKDQLVDWTAERLNSDNQDIFECMPVIKLFSVAHKAIDNSELKFEEKKSYYTVLAALIDDIIGEIYATIILLRGEYKTYIREGFFAIEVLKQIPDASKQRIETHLLP